MIDHSNCDHERTRAARSRCRREKNGSLPRERKSKKTGATPRAIGEDDAYGQTPGRKDMECHKCGVERITHLGTDPLTGMLLYVGDRCLWYIRRAPDLTPSRLR